MLSALHRLHPQAIPFESLEQVTLASPAALREALQRTLLIDLPDDPSLDSALAGLIA